MIDWFDAFRGDIQAAKKNPELTRTTAERTIRLFKQNKIEGVRITGQSVRKDYFLLEILMNDRPFQIYFSAKSKVFYLDLGDEVDYRAGSDRDCSDRYCLEKLAQAIADEYKITTFTIPDDEALKKNSSC